MGKRTILMIAGVLISVLLIAACSNGATTTSTATQPPGATPTPEITDTIRYTTNNYEALVQSGNNTVPNTQIRYVAKQGDLFELNIDGLQAFRRSGDTITWRGLVAPGLHSEYQLALATGSENSLFTRGTVNATVFNPVPEELQAIPPLTEPGVYSNLFVQYRVPQGQRIPGTTLVFEEVTDQGVRFSGTAQYPYYGLNSSLIWVGKLRNDVYIRYDLILAAATEAGLEVTGSAELRFLPYRPLLQAVPFN